MKLSTAVQNIESPVISILEDTTIDPPQLIISHISTDNGVEILHCQNSENDLTLSDVAQLLFRLGYNVTFEAS